MYILAAKYSIGFDFLMTGFARILVIIAILQLVKKIPDIINTIFGTKIQSKSGIKGRLGEMAGVGGLAQRAWTSLGGLAKGIGATSLFGAAGAIAGGAKLGLDKVASGSGKAADIANKVRDTYGKLKNSRVGAVARTASAGIKTKGKGTAGAMLETWNKQPINAAHAQQKINQRKADINKKHNINPGSTASQYIDADAIATYKDADGNIKTIDVNNSFQKNQKRGRRADEDIYSYNAYNREYNAANIRKARARDEKRISNADRDIGDIVSEVGNYKSKYVSDQTDAYAKKIPDFYKLKQGKSYQDQFMRDLTKAIDSTGDGSQEQLALTTLESKLLSPNFYKNSDGTQKNSDQIIREVHAAIRANGLDKYFGNYDFSIGNLAQFAVATEKLPVGADRNPKSLEDRVGEKGSLTVEVNNIKSVLEKEMENTKDPIEKERFATAIRDIEIKSAELAKDSIHLDFLDTTSGKQSIADAPVQPAGANFAGQGTNVTNNFTNYNSGNNSRGNNSGGNNSGGNNSGGNNSGGNNSGGNNSGGNNSGGNNSGGNNSGGNNSGGNNSGGNNSGADNRDLINAINDMSQKITEAVGTEGKATRDAIKGQGTLFESNNKKVIDQLEEAAKKQKNNDDE